MHGHFFYLVASNEDTNAEFIYADNYIRRDTVSVTANGWAKLRITTNNPGVWKFYCHIKWHITAGLSATFIEGPSLLMGAGMKGKNGFEPVPELMQRTCHPPFKQVAKIGGYFNDVINATAGEINMNQAQALAAFWMAVNEINASPDLLPNVELQVAIRGGPGFSRSIIAAQDLLIAKFSKISRDFAYLSESNVGVDIVVGAGSNLESEAADPYLGDSKITLIHTVAMDTQLTYGATYPYKLQTTPVDSFQGNC
jgi:hypothetical protein